MNGEASGRVMSRVETALLGCVLFILAGCSASAQTDEASGSSDPIERNCMARGGAEAACACVAREARTRFSPTEIDVIAIASDPGASDREERARRLEALGLSTTEMSTLTRRMIAAETVIQQSCGAGLLRTNAH